MSVTVSGLAQVDAGLVRAGGELQSLTVAHERAAAIIVGAARPPVRTGRLRASIRPWPSAGALVASDVPYAALVEARTHFLRTAAESTRPQWLAAYEQAVAEVCGSV